MCCLHGLAMWPTASRWHWKNMLKRVRNYFVTSSRGSEKLRVHEKSGVEWASWGTINIDRRNPWVAVRVRVRRMSRIESIIRRGIHFEYWVPYTCRRRRGLLGFTLLRILIKRKGSTQQRKVRPLLLPLTGKIDFYKYKETSLWYIATKLCKRQSNDGLSSMQKQTLKRSKSGFKFIHEQFPL